MKAQIERLIKLITDAQRKWVDEEYDNDTDKKLAEYVAVHLLADGVIVPPCKVGTPLYVLYEVRTGFGFEKIEYGINIRRLSDVVVKQYRPIYLAGEKRFDEEDIGVTVFYTLEEAQQALVEAEKKLSEEQETENEDEEECDEN